MIRNNYATPPNPKHAITFAVVSVAILILPLFWSPLNEQSFTPLATATPMTVGQMLASPATPAPSTPSLMTQATPAPKVSQTPAPKASSTLSPANSTPAPLVVEAPETQSPVSPAPRYHDPTMEFSGQLRRIVLSLLVTTLLIAFTLKVAQKHVPALGGGPKPGSFMNILAREAISPTQSLALVKVGGKILLVGLSEQNMTTLSEFSEADLESLIPKAPEPEARTAKSMYGEVLRHYFSIVPGMGAKK